MDEDLCDVLKRRVDDCYDDDCYDGRRFVDKPYMGVKSVEPWPQTQHY
jgi:hypothetical protein